MWNPPSEATVAARQEIKAAVYSYCRAMDRIDRELGLTLWAPGAEVDYGPIFRGSAIDFIEWVCRSHEKTEARSHQISNVLIDIDVAEGHATSESYVTAALRDDREGTRKDRIIRGRYIDTWVVHDGRWLIKHRRFQHDLTSVLPSLQA